MKMTRLFLSLTLFSNFVLAGDQPFLGGVLQSPSGHKVFAQCSKEIQGSCSAMNIYIQDKSKYPENVVYNFSLQCQEIAVKNLNKHYRRHLNQSYGDNYLFLSHAAEKACSKQGNHYADCIGPVILAFPFSLPFVPLVMLAQAGANLGTINKKRKLADLFNFLMKGNQSEIKTISNFEYSVFKTLHNITITGNRYEDYSRCIQADLH